MNAAPCNPNLQKEARELLEFLAAIEGRAILTGQHTQTREQAELAVIERETGDLPAVCGFELLGYSPNINFGDATPECIEEVENNRGTLELARAWGERGGIITFTWHWFSPLGGRDKAFYSCNTEFDPERALDPTTAEHRAFVHDLDRMAELLRPFCDAHLPVLWRPFHESDGVWFWWGRKGNAAAVGLYKFMFRYYTEHHRLDNLIWVWNNPTPDGYPGDEFCDIVSLDQYPPAHAHGAFRDKYERLRAFAPHKGAAIAETGIIPDADALIAERVPWLWYMTWSFGFALTEDHNSFDALRRLYHHDYAITLGKLPAAMRDAKNDAI